MLVAPLDAAVRRFQGERGLAVDGIVGPITWKELARETKRLSPRHVSFPRDEYRPPDTWMGLQPWIVPQAIGLATRFGLTVTAGWGTHPPHVARSDHRWGGAVDLVGSRARMVECNLWADGVVGRIFRWVGGPARDVGGVEPGHTDHVHVSWFRYGPATSVFDALKRA